MFKSQPLVRPGPLALPLVTNRLPFLASPHLPLSNDFTNSPTSKISKKTFGWTPFTKTDVQQKKSSSDGGVLFLKLQRICRGASQRLGWLIESPLRKFGLRKLVRKSWPREIEAKDVGPDCNEQQEMSGVRMSRRKTEIKSLYSGHLFSFLGLLPQLIGRILRVRFHEKHNNLKGVFVPGNSQWFFRKNLGLLSCKGPSCHRNHYSRSLFCHHVCHHPRRRTCLSPGQHGGFLKTWCPWNGGFQV